MILAIFDGLTYGIPVAVALSAVALFGYMFGRTQEHARNKRLLDHEKRDQQTKSSAEVQRALHIASQLESIADDLRQDLARHRSQVDRFKSHLSEDGDSQEVWERLRSEADAMVGPTLELVSQLSSAYDKIRMHSQALANFSGGRKDPLTGLANSRALEEHLALLLKARGVGTEEFSVVMVSIDDGIGDQQDRDRRIVLVGQQLADGLRGDDVASRFGGDEFVVILPSTPLAGAGIFAERLRKTLAEKFDISICCGLAESMSADTPKSLLARADSATYSARAAGPGQQYVHTGAAIRCDLRSNAPEPAPAPISLPTSQAAAELSATDNSAASSDNADELAADTPVAVIAEGLPGPTVSGDLVGS